MRTAILLFFHCLTVALMLCRTPAIAEEASPKSATPPASAQPAESPAPPAEVKQTEVLAAAEALEAERRSVEERGQAEATEVAGIRTMLERFRRDAEQREAEDAAIFSQESPMERLPEMELYWTDSLQKLKDARKRLGEMGKQLDTELGSFKEQLQLWKRTLKPLRADAAPPEVVQRAEAVVTGLDGTLAVLKERREAAVSLQAEVAKAAEGVQQRLDEVKRERKEALRGVLRLTPDRPPIWSAAARAPTLDAGARLPLGAQWEALKEYGTRQGGVMIFSGFLFLLLVGMFRAWQRWAKKREGEEGALPELQRIAGTPICSALLVTVLACFWLYDQPPRLLLTILRTAMLIPAVVLLLRLIPRRFYPVLFGLVLCFLLDGVRAWLVGLPFWARVIFLVQMGVGAAACFWVGRADARYVPERGEGDEAGEDGLEKADNVQATRAEARGKSSGTLARGKSSGTLALAAWGFLLMLVLNVLGFGRLSMLGGTALIQSIYLAVVFAGLVAVWDGLVVGLLATPVMNRLGMVRRHRELIARRLRRWMRVAAVIAWAWFTLRFFALEGWVVGHVSALLNAQALGRFPSLLSLLEFVGVIWAAFLISRLVKFVLEEDVYPRVTLERGVPYAISTVLHYAILCGGFFLAVYALGDLTKVTILTGAFGVGLGFGLQNVVNNFVSGLILLFERPINVGDVVEVDKEAKGIVSRIGIRASTIKTLDGGEVVVPNGKLIADKVINWTRWKRQRLLSVVIPVASDSRPEQAMELIRAVAEKHEKVANFPHPAVYLRKVDAFSLELELRAWTNYYDELLMIESDLATSALAALAEAGIALRKAP